MDKMDHNVATQMSTAMLDYAKTLTHAERLRFAAYTLSLVNAIQQTVDISQDALWHAREETNLFDDMERDDPMEPGYHLHNMLEDLAENFDGLARIVAEDVGEIA